MLSDYSQHLTSRDLARGLRSRVGVGKITFDFSNVESVTSDFFEELFGKLLEIYGESAFMEHVSWSGLSLGHQESLQNVLSHHKHKR